MPLEQGNGYAIGTGSFTAAGAGIAVPILRRGDFNVEIFGNFLGTVVPERCIDGTNWRPFTYVDGSAPTYTAPFSTILTEPGLGVSWRLNCTSYTSGSIDWRISQ